MSKRVEEVGDLFTPRDGESLQGNGSSIAMKQLKKLEQGLFSKMLKLNVGGQLFLISLETLKKDSGNFETYHIKFKVFNLIVINCDGNKTTPEVCFVYV